MRSSLRVFSTLSCNDRCRRRLWSGFALCWFLLPLHLFAEIHQNGSQEILWQARPIQPEEVLPSPSGITLGSIPQRSLRNGLLVPSETILVWVDASHHSIEVIVADSFRVVDGQVSRMTGESLLGPEDLHILLPEPSAISTWTTTQTVREQGPFRLLAVTLYRARMDPSGEWVIPTHPEVRIHCGINTQVNSLREHFQDPVNVAPSLTLPQSLGQQSGGFGRGELKLSILEDGIYRVSYDRIFQDAPPPSQTIASAQIQLFSHGVEVPLYVEDGGDGNFESGDRLIFLGRKNPSGIPGRATNPDTDINVYWLEFGQGIGLRLVEESGIPADAQAIPVHTTWSTVHLEVDSLFDRLGQVDTNLPTYTRDHYFWTSLNSGHTVDLETWIPSPELNSSEQPVFRIAMHGLTYSESGQAPHQVYAFLNESTIGDITWVQQEATVLQSPPGLQLTHHIFNSSGQNQLSLFSPVSTEPGLYDRVMIDWMEVDYERRLEADGGELHFEKSVLNPDALLRYEIGNIRSTDVLLLKEDVSLIRDFELEEADAGWELRFEDEADGSTPAYWLAAGESIRSPSDIRVDTLADLRNEDGDLIILAPPALLPALETFIAFKESLGWVVAAVSLEDVYDEFNFGIQSPGAIRDFLGYAYGNWASHPQHVLLIGDAVTVPQLKKRDLEIRYLPTRFMQTLGWGAAESDTWYGDVLYDDGLPEMHVGRLPVSSTEELTLVIAKIMQYESEGDPGRWQNDILTIAGFESTFKVQSQTLLRDIVPSEFHPHRLFIDRDSEGQVFWGDTDSLVDQWNAGRLLINFMGHGGGAIWADRSLFTREDAARLFPAAPGALVTSMTCFTGSFAQVSGLGEVLIAETPGAAIGWLGSTGVGWIINDYLLVQPVLRELLAGGSTVGEAIDRGREEYALSNSAYAYLTPTMLSQYNFFGDPSLRLRIPQETSALMSVQQIYAPGDSLQLASAPAITGTLIYQVYNSENEPVWSTPRTGSLDGTTINPGAVVPMQTGSWRLVYTIVSGDDEVLHGLERFSVTENWLDHDPARDAQWGSDDSLRIEVRLQGDAHVDSVLFFPIGTSISTLRLTRLEEDTFRLVQQLSPAPGSQSLEYFLAAYDSGEIILETDRYRIQVPHHPDIRILAIRDAVKNGQVGIRVDLQSLWPPDHALDVFVTDTLAGVPREGSFSRILRSGHQQLFLPLTRPPGDYGCRVQIPVLADLNPVDNVGQAELQRKKLQYIPDLGITSDGAHPDSVFVWGSLAAFGGDDTCWVSLVHLPDNPEATASVSFSNGYGQFQLQHSEGNLSLDLSEGDSLLLQPAGMDNWQIPAAGARLPTRLILGHGSWSDRQGPELSMSIAGQRFFDGGYVDRQSQIQLIAEDESGFRWRKEDVEVLVDAQRMEIQLGDTAARGFILGAWAELELTDGEHEVEYRVRDALGNWSHPVQTTLVVDSEARIIDYGNYPNPFQASTLLIYELTRRLEEPRIGIYTLAGTKIKELSPDNVPVDIPMGAIGYHEIPWNGRDREGRFVANGVYYYRISGKVAGKGIHGPVGKIMKSR